MIGVIYAIRNLSYNLGVWDLSVPKPKANAKLKPVGGCTHGFEGV